MEKIKYDATYKIGKTTVHVVAPPPMSKEEKEKIEDEIRKAIWVIIDEQKQK